MGPFGVEPHHPFGRGDGSAAVTGDPDDLFRGPPETPGRVTLADGRFSVTFSVSFIRAICRDRERALDL